MNILAIDTSGSIASVALMNEQCLLGEFTINNDKTHSQKLMPMIDILLQNLGLTVKDIDCFAVAVGPGSYTGLRIGVATVKGLAQVTNKPVIGISTLHALANNIKNADYICPVIDARNENVFAGIYSPRVLEDTHASERTTVLEDVHISIDELLQKLQQLNKPIHFVGDGIFKNKAKILEALKQNAIFPSQDSILQKASSVAVLALEKYNKGETQTYQVLKPNYLRENNYVKINM